MNIGIAEFVLVLVTLGVTAGMIWTRPRRWKPSEWARDMGLELTARNEPLVRSYLTRTRVMRLGGAILGFLVPHLYSALGGHQLPVPFDWDLIDALVGYLLGAVCAEVTIARPKADVPTASLQPRELRDYLPPMLMKALRVTAIGGLALVVLYRVLPSRDSIDVNELPSMLVMAPTILVVLVGVELLQRYIVRRPQPVVDSDVVQADDAIRSASVRALAGAGIALELVIGSVHIFGIAVVSDVQLLRWALPWIALVCFVAALGSWARVTRPHKRPELGTRQGAPV